MENRVLLFFMVIHVERFLQIVLLPIFLFHIYVKIYMCNKFLVIFL